MIITGVGSRETPLEICEEMTKIGKWARENKHTLRSGHALGADWAFEKGAQESCIVFLPWDSFNSYLSSKAVKKTIITSRKLIEITKKFHPNFEGLKSGVIPLMERNACQVLGEKLDEQANVVICWTKDGNASGGTGQALRIAKAYKIPVFNMFYEKYNTCEKVINELSKIKQ